MADGVRIRASTGGADGRIHGISLTREAHMAKLRLELDTLNVQSFDTDGGRDRKGTVHGHDTVETEWCTGYPYCISKRCATPHDTCYGSCGCTNNCESQPGVCS